MREQITYTTDELLKEAAWERKAIDEGMARYYEHVEKVGIAGSDVNTSLLMRITPLIAESIKAKQDEIAAALTAPPVKGKSTARTKTSDDGGPLLCLVDPDTLAVSVANALLQLLLTEPEVGLRGALDAIEEAYIQAMGIQLWDAEDEDAAARFWKYEADSLSAMGSSGAARQRRSALKKRMHRLWADFREQDNSTEQTQLALSTMILSCVGFTHVNVVDIEKVSDDDIDRLMMVDNQPTMVIKELGPLAGTLVLRDHLVANSMERHLVLSDEIVDSIDSQIERGALTAVRNPVMLVKPKRWILADEDENTCDEQ